MTSAELIDELAQQTNLTKNQVQDFLAAFYRITTAALKTDNLLTLYNFGIFYRRHKPARHGVRGQHLPPGIIDAHWAIQYKPSAKIKAEIQS